MYASLLYYGRFVSKYFYWDVMRRSSCASNKSYSAHDITVTSRVCHSFSKLRRHRRFSGYISNFISHIIIDVIMHRYWNYGESVLVQELPVAVVQFHTGVQTKILMFSSADEPNAQSTIWINLEIAWFNFHSLISPSAAYMRHWIGSALVQIIACRLFGAEPLSKPMLGLLFIGPSGTNFSEILIKIQIFSFRKMRLKISSAKWRQFCQGDLS